MKTDNNLIRSLVEAGAPNAFATDEAKDTFIKDWYFARAYVASDSMMEKMCRVDHEGKITDSLKLTLEGTSSRMRAVLREVILRAHYRDFDESTGNNASVITILCPKDGEEEARRTLLETPFLGNYLHYLWQAPLNYLDIQICIATASSDTKADVTEQMLTKFRYTPNETIDTSRAEYANRIYCLGSDLSNLPSIDTANVEMYELPLNVFETENYDYDKNKSWEGLREVDKMSNVCCTDTFDLRKMMILREVNAQEKASEMTKAEKEKAMVDAVKKNILALSKCEHSRWVAEKLIMGFRPWTAAEHYKYDRMFKDEKKQFNTEMKKAKIHYDICSYQTLTRINPQNLKYDTFLVLAMLQIISKSQEAS